VNFSEWILLAQTDAAKTATENAASNGGNHLMLLVTVFVLAVFVGFEIITKIPPTLHTPLMSGSNAISGITIVGALLTALATEPVFVRFVGMLAIILATMNVVGGFLVTNRMLEMFRKKG
jgi:NAD(P) transhydrogenase subunit alpha